jgi:hypothetical protein
MTVLRDPQGAVFTASKYVPPSAASGSGRTHGLDAEARASSKIRRRPAVISGASASSLRKWISIGAPFSVPTAIGRHLTLS